MSEAVFEGGASPAKPLALHRVYEKRYRTSKYFLQDQLRYSEAVEDFRSVQDALKRSAQGYLRSTFRFVTEPVSYH